MTSAFTDTIRRWRNTALCVLAAATLTACPWDDDGPAPEPVVAPTISSQPAATAVTAGSAATFSVTAGGTAPLSYQWQRNGVAVAGATGASYTLATPSLSDGGAQFRVIVTNAAGTATSNAAVLTVNELVLAPAITVQPQAASAPDGASAGFSVAVGGTPPYSYQWRRNGTSIAGATGSSYDTPALELADSGALFSVVVSNGVGQATSGNATLTVTAVAPAIGSEPVGSSVTVGSSASFSVAATGSAPLAYQWRRNGNVIAGATASSYTTQALALADSGANYSVVVSNAGGSATSGNASITVAAAAMAPSIITAPQNASVVAGQAATFTAAANGTAPLAYQWLRNGTAIAGATAAAFTTDTALAADNGTRYSVRVSNAAGNATSSEAVLTVNAAISPLIGRAWAPGQLLETDDNSVSRRVQGIDDAGRVTVVFVKSNGTRNVLYASRGTPNGSTSAPIWTRPVAIDVQGGVVVNNVRAGDEVLGVHVSPAGNAVAYWYATGACTASTYNTNATSCRFWYAARFLASSGLWEEPVSLGAFPDGSFVPRINDRGDIAIRVPGWVRSGTRGYDERVAVLRRPLAAAGFQLDTLSDATLSGAQFGMDHSGGLLLVAEATANATTDVVAYRGTVDAGFGAPQTLDTRGNAATLSVIAVSTAGHQVVLWTQSNGTRTSVFAATSSGPTAAWVLTDLVASSFGSLRSVVVDDAGTAHLFELGNRRRWRHVAGQWTAPDAIPASNTFGGGQDCSYARNGDILCLTTSTGAWLTYDASRNVVVQAFSGTSPGTGFVLGVNTINRGIGYSLPLLSTGGVGFVSLLNGYDTLPSPAAPAGDQRSIDNLWGVYLK